MQYTKSQRQKALKKSEEILHRINAELTEAGFSDNEKGYHEAFASKMLIELNNSLLNECRLNDDIENVKRQLVNNLKSKK